MSGANVSVGLSPHRHVTGGVIAVLAVATCMLVTIEFAAVGLLPQLAAEMRVSLKSAGNSISSFALGAAVFGPVLTLFVTKWPAHRLLSLCVLIFGIGNVVVSLWPSYEAMLIIRAIQGALLAPFIGVASKLLSNLVQPEAAGRAIGQMNNGTVIGTVFVVPAIVALADRFGWRPVTLLVGVLALMLACVISYYLRGLETGQAVSWRRQTTILKRGCFLAHLGVSAMLFTSMFVSYSYIAVLLEGPLELSRSGVAMAMCVFGMAGIVGNHLVSLHVGRRPLATTYLIAASLTVIGAAMTIFIDYRMVALTLLLPWGAAYTAAFVACQVRVMLAARDAPAFAAALNIAACNFGIAIGAMIGGAVVEHFSVAAIGFAAGLVGLGAFTFSYLLR